MECMDRVGSGIEHVSLVINWQQRGACHSVFLLFKSW